MSRLLQLMRELAAARAADNAAGIVNSETTEQAERDMLQAEAEWLESVHAFDEAHTEQTILATWPTNWLDGAPSTQSGLGNPYLISFHTGTKVDAITLEHYFKQNGASRFYELYQYNGWLSDSYYQEGRFLSDYHTVPKYMSMIANDILQRRLWEPPTYTTASYKTVQDELKEAEWHLTDSFYKCTDAMRDRLPLADIQQEMESFCEAINEFMTVLHVQCGFHEMDEVLLDVQSKVAQIDFVTAFA